MRYSLASDYQYQGRYMNVIIYVQIYYKLGGKKLSRLISMVIILYSFVFMFYNVYFIFIWPHYQVINGSP